MFIHGENWMELEVCPAGRSTISTINPPVSLLTHSLLCSDIMKSGISLSYKPCIPDHQTCVIQTSRSALGC